VKLVSTKGLIAVAFAFLLASAVPIGVVGILLNPPQAQAQNIGQRVVSGTVFDASSSTVSGATVFLKDLKSKTIRSFTTDSKGKFRFTQVDMAEDHELWADKDGHKSAVKTVSEWDARKEYETELKLK
jgi:hypothetical protein